MYHIKNDQRSVRSANRIYEALVELMEEYNFTAIKVTDIVEKAQIGRATFYRNFDVQEDVLRWRCDQILNDLIPYIANFSRTQASTGALSLLKPIFRFFYLDSTILELLIKAERIDIFQVTFQKRIERFGPKAIALLDVPEDYIKYWLALRMASLVSLLVQWVKGGKQQAPDDLADGLKELAGQMGELNLFL